MSRLRTQAVAGSVYSDYSQIEFVGCVMIAARSRVLAKSLDKIELELRKLVHKLRYSDN